MLVVEPAAGVGALEVLGQPLVEPEREVAIGDVQECVCRLVAQVFLETLLHEWVHHYDFTGLELDRSPHTSGFFNRIRDLAETLGVGYVAPPKREVSSAAPPEDVMVAKDHLRPGGVPPPQWIRDQVLALFGHPRT